jgi:hypothetical protein
MKVAIEPKILLIIHLLIAVYFFGSTTQAKYGGGSGEPNDPYLIYTAEQLNAVGANPEDYDKHFRLMADVDLSTFIGTDFNIIGYERTWQDSKPFTGVFDGNDHKISNFTYTSSDTNKIGLFGDVYGVTACIKDLGLINSNVDVEGGDSVGLMVGKLLEGTIINCYTGGYVSGINFIGGLVGHSQGTITNCYAMADVSGTGYDIGGLAGFMDGTIINCYVTGNVSGGWQVGGLIGSNRGTIINSYTMADVSGTKNIGGLVGVNSRGAITNCYSNGSVTGTTNFGGLVGSGNLDRVKNSFWDIKTSGQVESAGGTGLTTDEMKDITTYIDAGWDFLGERENGLHEAWQMSENSGYPVLSVFSNDRPPILSGEGTPESPYLVSTAVDLGSIIYQKQNASYRLTQNINLSDITWCMSVIPDFEGAFDGNGLSISNLTIVGHNSLGLIGKIKNGGQVWNLGIVDANVTGTGDSIGILAGLNSGHVLNCYSTGLISGSEHVGGLIGNSNGRVALSCSTATIWGSECVGGLIGGNNNGNIMSCYSTGAVNGNEFIGGLVGYNSGDWGNVTVSYCYSTGIVSGYRFVGGLVGRGTSDLVVNSCWDVETSVLTISAGGNGLTTAEMMDLEILGLHGWGGKPDWILNNGRDYPRLAWEDTPGQMIPEPVIDWLDGSGKLEDPFQIETADQLLKLHEYNFFGDKNFILNADLDLNPDLPGRYILGRALLPTFGGSFIGNSHVIHNLRIEGGSYLGLFGKLLNNAIVRNIGLENVSIHGSGYYVGGLAGTCNGNIIQCYSKGTVCGVRSIGGLIGSNGGFVTTCYNNCVVYGDRYIGGLVGNNKGSVSDCYSTSSVSGNGYVGGLVGDNEDGKIDKSYSTGTVTGDWRVGGLVGDGQDESVAVCFWDIQTSGQTTSTGGTGKSTVEMQKADTFLQAGWDIIDETVNGTGDIWWIDEGQNYPKLRELPENLWLSPLLAFCPDPMNGATEVIQSPILSWVPTDSTAQNDIYFGESKKEVDNATTENLNIYYGRKTAGTTTFDPGNLEWGKTYYWRIDAVDETVPNSPWKGNVWCFTTSDFIVIDDFERYNDLSVGIDTSRIYQAWIDGFDNPENGSIVGYFEPPFCELTVVHGGNQSMPFFYDNSGSAVYSEATLTLTSLRDWTVERVAVLSLWFHGDPNNTLEPMYVALNGSAVAYYNNPETLLIEKWMEWTIDLQVFADQGVNLTNVNSITIGFGDKNNPQPGGSGLVFFDDIRVYQPASEQVPYAMMNEDKK